jgi:hypothetical protein
MSKSACHVVVTCPCVFVCFCLPAEEIVFKRLEVNLAQSLLLVRGQGIVSHYGIFHNVQTRLLLRDSIPMFIAVARKQELK